MAVTPDTIPTEYQYRALLIPNDVLIIGAVYGALLYLADTWYWQALGAVTPDEMAYRMLQMIYESADLGDVNVIGTIVGVIRGIMPANMLPCDGSTHNRVDYPRLYAMLDAAFVVDADTFVTPDLRGRVLVGVGSGVGLSTYTVNQMTGEELHTLTLSETPTHTHTDTGHTHVDGTTAPTVITIGAGAPAPSAIPAVGVTGSGSANLTTAGADDPHNNLQPLTALVYAVIAR